jgi:zinc protease
MTADKAGEARVSARKGGLDAPKRFALSGGGAVHVAESHAVPLVSITIALFSGAGVDPVGKEGASKLAFRMLRRGSRTHTAKDIEDALDRLGAELGTEVSVSSSAVHGQVIERNLGAFVDLLATLLAEPKFPEDELERLRRETLAELVEARDSDRSLAQQAFRKAVFKGHPYARSATGTKKTLESITQEDVRAAYRRHFVKGNLVLGLSGDVDTERARALAERLIAGLPEGARVADEIGEPKGTPGRRLVFVDKPERTQTQILIGGLGTSAHDADHLPLVVASAVLGGSFTSRLMREVRSKRGWSYGAYARMPIDRRRQAFSMWTFPAATDAAACIALELELLEKFVASGIDDKELSFIQRFLGRSYAFEVDTASKRLHQGLDVEVLGLPDDYYTGYLDKLAKVKASEANEAVKARVSVDDLLVVVVGTASVLEDKVREVIPRLGEHEVVPFDREE